MATAALRSLTQGTRPENSQRILEAMIIPLVSLIDDNSIATRSHSLTIFLYAGVLKYDQLNSIGTALLSRLDDPGNEVRVKAAKCLGKLKLAESEHEEFNDMWEHLLKQIISTMMIHLESPEIDLRNALISSLNELAESHSKVYEAAFKESLLSDDLKSKLKSVA